MKAKTKNDTIKHINKLMVIDVKSVLSFGNIKWYRGKYVRTVKE